RCPPKVKETGLCRSQQDECDKPEFCDGQSADCPQDELQPQGTPCGEPPAECQIASTCTGFSKQCPAPAPEQDGNPCSDPSCDDDGQCKGGVCQLPCVGDAQVTSGRGKVIVTCTLDDLNGDERASCTGTGYLAAAGPSTRAGTRALPNGCVPG